MLGRESPTVVRDTLVGKGIPCAGTGSLVMVNDPLWWEGIPYGGKGIPYGGRGSLVVVRNSLTAVRDPLWWKGIPYGGAGSLVVGRESFMAVPFFPPPRARTLPRGRVEPLPLDPRASPLPRTYRHMLRMETEQDDVMRRQRFW